MYTLLRGPLWTAGKNINDLTDLLSCVGGLSVAVAMDIENDTHKKIEMVSVSLLS